MNDGLRAQTTPLPGTRPAPLPVVAGSQGVWPGAPRQPGSVLPSVVSPALAAPAAETVDAAALSFLLAQSLAAQQQEEEKAKEQAAVAELETQVAAAEDRLLVQLQREREEGTRITRQTWSTLSRVEQLAVHWFMARKAVEEKKEEDAEEYSTWLFWEMTALVLGSCVRFSSCSPLFPFSAKCLVLSGTCYTSVYGVVVFQVFLREKVDYGS